MNNKKRLKNTVMTVGAILIGAVIVFAFWPKPKDVDTAVVAVRPLSQSISEQGRTQVRNRYTVSAPVAGQLSRIDFEAGDVIDKGTVVATLYPSPSSLLDAGEYHTAQAALKGARSAYQVTEARLIQAKADVQLAQDERNRVEQLYKENSASLSEYQQATRNLDSSRAEVEAQQASMTMRKAEIAAASSRLERFSGQSLAPVKVHAPVSGVILKVIQKSEQQVNRGAELVDIADIDKELEVLVELLTSDAVKVSRGDSVDIDDWGGETLHGYVDRIEPGGFIKYSALGVEEQRVNVFIRFNADLAARKTLGDGFRVDCTIYTWQSDSVLTIPVSALFRQGQQWAAYRIEQGRVVMSELKLGHRNAYYAEVLSGMSENDTVVLYPDSELIPGDKVSQRK